MLRRLKKHPRPDKLANQKRASGNEVGRYVYLGLLGALALGVLNFLYGDMIVLRADGVVLRDKTSIASTYIARIDAIMVKEGQSVSKGDPLLQLQSTQMLERLADLSARRARIVTDAAEFRIRAETVVKMLPLATRRAKETAKVLDQFDELSKQQLVTTVRHDQALRSRFEARQSLVRLSTESKTLKGELKALDAAKSDAVEALARLRSHYADGLVRAPSDGAVGASIPSVGDVHRPGETILSIYSGDAYVLAYLPSRYLFSIEPDMRVSISSGRQTATGVVEKILPVTDALPKEFQNTFKPRDRNQLARIRLDGTPPFPLHEKVEVTAVFPWF